MVSASNPAIASPALILSAGDGAAEIPARHTKRMEQGGGRAPRPYLGAPMGAPEAASPEEPRGAAFCAGGEGAGG